MTSVLNQIEQTLFFSDVPEGTLKQRKSTSAVTDKENNDAGIMGAISDTLFFSDLISVANQSTAKSTTKRSASPDAISQVRKEQEGSDDSTVKIQNQTQQTPDAEKDFSKKAKLYKKVFAPRGANKNADAMSVCPSESPLQTKSRGMTIAPPALARMKKQEKQQMEAARKELEAKEHELHVKEISRKLRNGEL